jgi:hypothetical protein
MATLAEIYSWFMTGKKPTQAQFWASWGSFWNKSESIPQSSVSNLTTVLNAKAEKTQFDAHKVALDAHPQLLLKARIIPFGQMLVFKIAPNENEAEKEPGDFCIGIVENQKIEGIYLGGDGTLLAHYEISNQLEI